MSDDKSRRDQVRNRNKKTLASANPQEAPSREDNKPGLATRRTAHRLMGAIIDKRTSLDALTDDQNGNPHYLALEARDRALLRAILMVALRHRVELDLLIDSYVDKALPAGATALRNVLHVAFAQILFLDIPDHSAVDLAVESANRDPRLKRFASLINALTRRAVRHKDAALKLIKKSTPRSSTRFSDRLIEVYGPDKAARIEAAHRLEAPIDFTVKVAGEIEYWASELGADILPTGSLRIGALETDIQALSGYQQGAWWVQDTAASLPVKLFGELDGKLALDLCAAPGGKTAQLLAMGASVTALDMSANRLRRLAENLERLRLGAQCKLAATSLFDFEPDQQFDAVLLDAPCSSTGTVRRHPDIPWTKTWHDIEKLADLQSRMLDNAAHFVAPGGQLVFSNCSLDPLEGEEVVRRFLADQDGFKLRPVDPAQVPGCEDRISSEGFIRTTPADLTFKSPHLSGLDGFFAAIFERIN